MLFSPLPPGPYEIIYADPPWGYANKGSRGAAEKHYGTLSVSQLMTLPVQDITAPNCLLFLWATYPMIQEAIQVGSSWGFQYKTLAFQWLKTNIKTDSWFFGAGNWTRANTEACLLFVKGKPKRASASVSQVIVSPRRSHSEKPKIVRGKIKELCGDLPRIELFSRDRCGGWDAWGLQVPENEKE